MSTVTFTGTPSSMGPHKLLLAGAGDLSQRAASALRLTSDMPVWGIRRNPPRTCEHSDIHWIAADLNKLGHRALPSGITHVLYAPTPDERTEKSYRDIFVGSLTNLLDQLDPASLQRVVFVSSSAVYGASHDWVTEDTPACSDGFNGRILLEAEQYLHQRLPGIAVSIRFSGLYGPGRTRLLERLQSGRIPSVSSMQWTNRIHIDDAARACAHLLMLPDALPCYIGTDDTPYQQADLYRMLASQLGVSPPLKVSTPVATGAASAAQGKRLSNARLIHSGFKLQWPDAKAGYAALINTWRPDTSSC